VVLVSAVRTGWRRYRVTATPFSERIEVPRKEREAALRAVIERFAQSLEEICREAPTQWFNYFDFWKGSRNTP
jgi:predicted LPLAT superfamily acyltransferase